MDPRQLGQPQPGWDAIEQQAQRAQPGAGHNGWPAHGASGVNNGVNGGANGAGAQPIPRSSSMSPPMPRQPGRDLGQGPPSARQIPYQPPEERPPWEEDEPGYAPEHDELDYAPWEWDPALNQSMPGFGADDLAASGKFNVVLPLAPGESAWGRGLSAPKPIRSASVAIPPGAAVSYPEVEEDAQPSTRMRALQPGNLARATIIVSAAILISRILGLFRTSLFAYAFGAGPDASAFTYAFTLPDTIFNIVAGGALASAFIPVFTDYLVNRRDRNTAWHIASAAFNISTLLLVILAGLLILFASPVLHLVMSDLFVQKPGVVPLGPQVVLLTQIMLLQPIFLGAATMGVAVLQARQRFLLPAVGQVIYNVGLIAGIAATILDQRTHLFGGHLGILGPTWGVVLGAALQFVVQLPGLVGAKMRYRPTFDLFHPGVREMFRLMGPRIFNAAASYAAIIITTSFLVSIDVNGGANGIGYGYRTAFSLMLLPLGLFGMAVSQAAFPTLAALVADQQWQRLRDTVLSTLRGVLYLAIPSALGLAVLANPISQLLLAHGHFTQADVRVVAVPLIYFSIGLVGLSMDEILVRCFYALHDSRTPVLVNCANLAFVIGLSVILLGPLGAGGLALAFALGAIGEAPVLLLLLLPRLGGLDLGKLGIFTLNVLAASLVTVLTAFFIYTLGSAVLPSGGTGPRATAYLAVELGVGIGVAAVVYFAFSRFLGIDDAVPLDRLLRRVLRR